MPLLVILDDAGNICRIPDLPDRYSHYRDGGMVVVTILQSEDQGKQAWPHGGFEKLLAASMVQVFAGGNASASFYRDMSERIGDFEVRTGRRTPVAAAPRHKSTGAPNGSWMSAISTLSPSAA